MSKRNVRAAVPPGLGDRIRAAREERGWTQPELGRMVGVSKSAVHQWESGAVQNLKLGNLFAVASVLGKDVRDLVFGMEMAQRISERAAKYSVAPQALAMLQMYDDMPTNVQRHIRGLLSALHQWHRPGRG